MNQILKINMSEWGFAEIFTGAVVVFGVIWGFKNFLLRRYTHGYSVDLTTETKDGFLGLRHLTDGSLIQLLQNDKWFERIVKLACYRCSPDNMFIRIGDWQYSLTSAAVNAVSRLGALGHMIVAAGGNLQEAEFVVAATFEAYGDMSQRKFRILVVERSQLVRWYKDQEHLMSLEVKVGHQESRKQSMLQLSRKFLQEEGDFIDPRKRLTQVVKLALPMALQASE